MLILTTQEVKAAFNPSEHILLVCIDSNNAPSHGFMVTADTKPAKLNGSKTTLNHNTALCFMHTMILEAYKFGDSSFSVQKVRYCDVLQHLLCLAAKCTMSINCKHLIPSGVAADIKSSNNEANEPVACTSTVKMH